MLVCPLTTLFEGENPWVYQEERDCRVETLVERPRMFPQAQLPQLPGVSSLDLFHVDLALVEELHDVTGRVLAQVRGQSHGPLPASVQTRSPLPDDPSVSELSPGIKSCPICKKTFREYNKLKVHFNTQHKRSSEHLCPKCGKCGTAANLASHLENFHKYKNYVCITCQHATQYKRDMLKHEESSRVGGSPRAPMSFLHQQLPQ